MWAAFINEFRIGFRINPPKLLKRIPSQTKSNGTATLFPN
jgi:hypothetical protein